MNVNGWTIYKEFDDDGPSSKFVWVAERPGDREEFPLRRDAIAFVRTREGGDCFEVALHFVMSLGDNEDYRVVHGWPLGQGPIAGVKHAHAWVERHDPIPDVLPENVRAGSSELFVACIDKSNGKDIEWPRALYYGIGKIDPAECAYYTVTEAARLAVCHGHFGPWHKPS